MVSLASSLSPPPPLKQWTIPASIKDRVSASTQVHIGLSQGAVQEAHLAPPLEPFSVAMVSFETQRHADVQANWSASFVFHGSSVCLVQSHSDLQTKVANVSTFTYNWSMYPCIFTFLMKYFAVKSNS